VKHAPTYGGVGRLYWVTCSCGTVTGAYHRDVDAARAFALHASRQVSVSDDPTLTELLRTVASQ